MILLSKFHKGSGRYFQGFCQNTNVHERYIPLATLNSANVTSGQPTFERQRFLRQPLGLSQFCQSFAKLFLDVQNSIPKGKDTMCRSTIRPRPMSDNFMLDCYSRFRSGGS